MSGKDSTVAVVYRSQRVDPPRVSGECKLFAAILSRALLDITDKSTKVRNEALNWITNERYSKRNYTCNFDMCLEAVDLMQLKETIRSMAIYMCTVADSDTVKEYRKRMTHSGIVSR